MATIKIACTCGKTIEVPASWAGKTGKCQACGRLHLVPTDPNADLTFRLHCQCGKTLIIPMALSGRSGRCQACGRTFTIPEPTKPPVLSVVEVELDKISPVGEDLIPLVLKSFDVIDEMQIGEAERALLVSQPNNPDRALLYALRVSKCVLATKSFKTLASRWQVAFGEPPSKGLCGGASSPHCELVLGFLVGVYCKRFSQIALDFVERAKAKAETARSKNKAVQAWYHASEEITEGWALLGKTFAKLEDYVDSMKRYCQYQVYLLESRE